MSGESAEYVAGSPALRLGEDDRRRGWMVFCGTLLLILGCANIIDGIAAVNGSHTFLRTAHYVIGDLNTAGWLLWVVGIAQGLTAVGILLRNQWARWLGIVFAFMNALTQLLMVQSYPFWCLAMFSLDIIVIYGLLVYGGESYEPV